MSKRADKRVAFGYWILVWKCHCKRVPGGCALLLAAKDTAAVSFVVKLGPIPEISVVLVLLLGVACVAQSLEIFKKGKATLAPWYYVINLQGFDRSRYSTQLASAFCPL